MADQSGWRILPPTVAREQEQAANFPAIDRVRGPGATARMLAAQKEIGGDYGFLEETIGPIADEINAGVSAAGDWLRGRITPNQVDDARFGDLYNDYKRIVGAEQDAYREAHPVAAFGANVVGGLALGVPAAGNALAAAGARAAPVATNALAAVGQGAKSGAAFGAATGFAEGEGLTNRIETAATGGAVGAGIGAATPLVANLAQRVGGAVKRLTGLKGEAAETRAREMVTTALQQDGVDIAALAKNRKPLTVADLGPNTRALVGSASRQGGRGKEQIETFFENRTLGQYGRITDDVAGSTGMRGEDFSRTAADIAESRAVQAAENYGAARVATAPALSDNAQSILATPSGKSAVATARNMMANKRAPIRDADGNYTVEMLDQIQRAMRDASNRASGNRAGEMAANLSNLRDDFLREVPDELRTAMANYRSKSELIDSMQLGRDFLKGDAENLTGTMAGMTPQQKDMFRLGVARELRGKMGSKIDSGDISGMFQNPQIRERLATVFPSKRLFQDFMDSVKTERLMQTTRNEILKGSPTAPRMAADAEFGAGALGEFASDMTAGGGVGVGLTRAISNAALKGKDRYLQGVNEAVAGNIADLATNTNLPAVSQALRAPQGGLPQSYPVSPMTQPTGSSLAALAASGGQAATAPAGWTILPPQ